MLGQETDKTKTSNAIDIFIENLSKQHDNSRKLNKEMRRPPQFNREEENETETQEEFQEDKVQNEPLILVFSYFYSRF